MQAIRSIMTPEHNKIAEEGMTPEYLKKAVRIARLVFPQGCNCASLPMKCAPCIIAEAIAQALSNQHEAHQAEIAMIREKVESIKIDLEASVCDCGEALIDTDAYDYTTEALTAIRSTKEE
jgi:hypothetical protein